MGYHIKQACRLSPEADQWKKEQVGKKAKKAGDQKRREQQRKEILNHLGIISGQPKNITISNMDDDVESEEPSNLSKLDADTITIIERQE